VGSVYRFYSSSFPIRLGRRHHPPLIEQHLSLLKGFRELEEKMSEQKVKQEYVGQTDNLLKKGKSVS
jgi:hypothetical protein